MGSPLMVMDRSLAGSYKREYQMGSLSYAALAARATSHYVASPITLEVGSLLAGASRV